MSCKPCREDLFTVREQRGPMPKPDGVYMCRPWPKHRSSRRRGVLIEDEYYSCVKKALITLSK